jgi:hypothetical protein
MMKTVFWKGQVVPVFFPQGIIADAYTGRVWDDHNMEGVVMEHTNPDRPRFAVEYDEDRKKLVSDGEPA